MAGTEGDAVARIRELRSRLGKRIAIAAHHYQRPEIVALSDIVADSYKLALWASHTEASYIVHCGVRFMAESAAILAREGQVVLVPDPVSGCPMSDMLDEPSALGAIQAIGSIRGIAPVPVIYMNSSAEIKALAGRLGGAICSSSNARFVLESSFERGLPVFFGPDRNLGINTARDMGISPDLVFTIGRDGLIRGSGDPSRGLLYLWDGFCHVHRRFSVADVSAARARVEGVRVIVHPECDEEVVRASDLSGSTEALAAALREGEPGSSWVVGTEANFVRRLASELPDRSILPLRESYCFNMGRVDAFNLLASLESVAARERDSSAPLLHRVSVPPSTSADAAKALDAMIAITEKRR
ncbi:MAG: quinolinate synthase [Treponema sp.]|nr:quinolinate synthase [Treponema sp.]